MVDLGRFRKKWVEKSNRWGAGLKRGWGGGCCSWMQVLTRTLLGRTYLVFQSEHFKIST
jgi:hypothetical protein